jgi:hypothetical protein
VVVVVAELISAPSAGRGDVACDAC